MRKYRIFFLKNNFVNRRIPRRIVSDKPRECDLLEGDSDQQSPISQTQDKFGVLLSKEYVNSSFLK